MVVDRGHPCNGEILDNMIIMSPVALSRKRERSSHPSVACTNITRRTRGISLVEQIHGVGGAALGDGVC